MEDDSMNNKLTEMVFIMDRSGSMMGLESSTVSNYKEVLQKQSREDGEVLVTTVLFSDDYNIVHDRCDLKKINLMDESAFRVYGMTALMDAVGNTIIKIQRAQDGMIDSERPGKTIFVIITDGMENSSKEFTESKIKRMITEKREKHGWEFMFLGANIDAKETAKSYGIDANMSMEFIADRDGLRNIYGSVAKCISDFRRE